MPEEQITVDASVFETLTEETDANGVFADSAVEEIENTETPPAWYSEEWNDYVMRQFSNDELENGNPVRDGLQRVAERLIGPIANREIISFVAASKENYGEATVHIRLTFVVQNETHALYGQRVTEDGIANVSSTNTPAPFNFHQPGSAASKAEAQALRKALRLRRIISADEVTPEDALGYNAFVPDVAITQEHINILDLLCRKLNINLLEFINVGEAKYVYVEQVPGGVAQRMIQFLGEVQSGHKTSPCKNAYDPGWREKNEKKRNPQS